MSRLVQHVASMVALEGQIESTLAEIVEQGIVHSEADALLKRIHAIAEGHRTALGARLQATRGEISASEDQVNVPALGDLSRATGNRSAISATFALHTVYTMLSHAIFGYTILQAIAHRFRDSKVTGEENTGDVSEQHTRNYAAAAQEINQLIHDVVLWELNRAGDECRCSCPSCSLGVCLCAVSSRAILNSAWADSTSARPDGILVQTPRSDSAAAKAGLQEGDVVLAADEQPIQTHQDLQGMVREHQSSEDITLQVQREGVGTLDIVVERA